MSPSVISSPRTFAEITSAYNRKDHIFLEVEASQLGLGRLQINLNLFTESVLMFETIVNLDGGEKSARLSAYIYPESGGSFEIAELVQRTQIGGLTFVTSDTAPTVDDRNIITFVIEG